MKVLTLKYNIIKTICFVLTLFRVVCNQWMKNISAKDDDKGIMSIPGNLYDSSTTYSRDDEETKPATNTLFKIPSFPISAQLGRPWFRYQQLITICIPTLG